VNYLQLHPKEIAGVHREVPNAQLSLKKKKGKKRSKGARPEK
jgi:hypothetical protein